jgi:hypothetical protein
MMFGHLFDVQPKPGLWPAINKSGAWLEKGGCIIEMEVTNWLRFELVNAWY